MNLTAQRALDREAQASKPTTKRKPSARAAFRLEEIPAVAGAMTGTYATRYGACARMNSYR
jgi:hypothetical protein